MLFLRIDNFVSHPFACLNDKLKVRERCLTDPIRLQGWYFGLSGKLLSNVRRSLSNKVCVQKFNLMLVLKKIRRCTYMVEFAQMATYRCYRMLFLLFVVHTSLRSTPILFFLLLFRLDKGTKIAQVRNAKVVRQRLTPLLTKKKTVQARNISHGVLFVSSVISYFLKKEYLNNQLKGQTKRNFNFLGF